MQQTKRVKNPSKQRKRLFNAPAHIRHKLMSAPLSRELTASRGAKTLPVRKGDTILIKRGDNKGFEGKVSRVDLKAFRIYIEGLTREKVDGTNIFLPIHPSKVEIRNLNLDDKWRKKILDRKQVAEKPAKAEKAKAKPSKKAEKAPAKEEKPIDVTPVEEEVVPEVAEEQAAEMTTEEASAKAKKPATKKATKKAPVKETEEETAEPKAKAKKTSVKTKGGQ
jgi:large subunit ribosomal protein L24